jgi:hypothetical protein
MLSRTTQRSIWYYTLNVLGPGCLRASQALGLWHDATSNPQMWSWLNRVTGFGMLTCDGLYSLARLHYCGGASYSLARLRFCGGTVRCR